MKFTKRMLSMLVVLTMILSIIPAMASAETIQVTDEMSYVENAAGWVEIDNLSEFNTWFRDTAEDSILKAASKAGKTVTAKLILKSNLAINVSAYVGTDDYRDAHNITLDLNGHTITSNNNGSRRCFAIYDSSLTLLNGTITMPGLNSSTGGIFYVNGGSLTMRNVNVTRTQANASTKYGGGILGTNSANVYLENCVFDASGSASVKNGGIAYLTSGTQLTMVNSQFIGGRAVDAESNEDVGGNVHILGGTLNIYNSKISGGYAGYRGGNIYMTSSAVVNMYSGTIENGENDAVSGTRGGNIYFYTGTFNMYGGDISEGESYNGKSMYAEGTAKTFVNFYGGTIRHSTATDYSGTKGFFTKASSATLTSHELTIVAPKVGSLGPTYYVQDCTTISEKDENGAFHITANELVAGEPVAATCTTPGYTPYTCTCGAVIHKDIVPATGHTEQAVPGYAATCTATGMTDGKACADCGIVLAGQYAVKKLGHNQVTDAPVAPDCVNTGLTEGAHCDRCGTVITAQEEIPALGHSYSSVRTEATFEANAFTTHTCTVCGYSYVETHEGTQLTGGAVVNGTHYGTLTEAMEKAEAGATIQLLQPATAGELLITGGITLDLNGQSLTADTLVVTGASKIIDSTNGEALLAVGREAISIVSEEGYLPVWDAEAAGYRFVEVSLRQSAMINEAGNGYLRFYIEGEDANCVLQQALANGGADNGVYIQVKLSWTDVNGNKAQRTFIYDDALLMQYAENWTGNEFRLTVTGMKNVTELNLTAAVAYKLSENEPAAFSVSGETKTLEN